MSETVENTLEKSNKAELLNQQGEQFFVDGEMDKAFDAFKEAIETDPDFVVPYNNLGVLFWQSGDISNALKHFAEALKTDQNDQNTALNYGAVLISLEKYDDAAQIYNSYLLKHPDDKDITAALMELESKKRIVLKSHNDIGSSGCPKIDYDKEIRSVSKKDIFKHTNRISFELSNLCNYAGIHKKCPLHKIEEPVILPARIVYNVMDTLAKHDFKGMIAFHTYNEPMIDPRLFSFIEYAKHSCPESYIYICTNGYYFNDVMAGELVDTGVSEVHISAYSQSEYKRLSSIKIDVPFTVELMKLDDRLNLYQREENEMDEPCYAPLKEIIISREGSISLCCLDWRRDCTFGDLHKQTFEEVLKTGVLHAVYEKLSRGERFLHICKRCGWVRWLNPI